MTDTTHRSTLLIALVGCMLGGGLLATPGAAADEEAAAGLRVGHTVKRIVVPGSTQGEPRQVDVHLWYPADQRGLSDRPRTVYASRLHGVPLIDELWDPLSWTVEAEVAREGAPIDPHGAAFPVIVFSHGSVNDPIDYAHTLELIAGAGFVVAAPYHVNNTQDDVRIDFINRQAQLQGRARLFECSDGLEPPCSRTDIGASLRDRVRDVSSILDNLPEWLGDRVDVARAGVLGHSRGTVTALAAAGGFLEPLAGGETRVKAIMGLAIGAPAVTFRADVDAITVPALLVAGALDETSPQAITEDVFERIGSPDKGFVSIANATHRSFDSTYCDQAQSAGAAAQLLDANGGFAGVNPRAILDLHTVRGIAGANPSGRATQYCSAATFTSPTDIRGLVASLTGMPFPEEVPITGLETDEVKRGVKELAVAFFGTVLKRTGDDGPHFTRFLAPEWLERHVPMVGEARAFAGPGAICPPGQEVVCAD